MPKIISTSINPRQQRQFLVGMAFFLILLSFYKLWRGHSTELTLITLFSVGTFLGLSELFLPQIANPLFALWMKFAAVLGHVNTLIIVSLVFFFVLTPVGLFRRLFVKNSANSDEACRKRKSAWFALEGGVPSPESYLNPY